MAQSLSIDEAERLRLTIQLRGLEATAEALQLNTTTLLRAACGLQLHNATRQLIQRALEETNHAEESPR